MGCLSFYTIVLFYKNDDDYIRSLRKLVLLQLNHHCSTNSDLRRNIHKHSLCNILTFGFEINWLDMNTFVCKFHTAYSAFTATSIFVINCLILFDRYAMSSRSVRMRPFSSEKMTRLLLASGLILVCCLISTPVVVLFENVATGTNGTHICTSKSQTFLLLIASIYYPIIKGLMPTGLLVIYFWFFTRKHVYHFLLWQSTNEKNPFILASPIKCGSSHCSTSFNHNKVLTFGSKTYSRRCVSVFDTRG